MRFGGFEMLIYRAIGLKVKLNRHISVNVELGHRRTDKLQFRLNRALGKRVLGIKRFFELLQDFILS